VHQTTRFPVSSETLTPARWHLWLKNHKGNLVVHVPNLLKRSTSRTGIAAMLFSPPAL
jgi:hypothetical protein